MMVNEMTYYGDELDKDLKEKLDLLQEIPPRDPATDPPDQRAPSDHRCRRRTCRAGRRSGLRG